MTDSWIEVAKIVVFQGSIHMGIYSTDSSSLEKVEWNFLLRDGIQRKWEWFDFVDIAWKIQGIKDWTKEYSSSFAAAPIKVRIELIAMVWERLAC